MHGASRPRTAALVAAFGLIYLVWGSTYWAIRVGLDSFPPFLLGALRFGVAGALLLAYARLRDDARPTRDHWKAATITGLLMLLVGNGAVILAERRTPTGLVALIVTTVPLWMVLLDWLRPGGRRPGPAIFLGLILGTWGITLLVNPAESLRGAAVPPFEAFILLLGSAAWAVGSLYSRAGHAPGPASLLAGLQMLVASAAFLLAGLVAGEVTEFDLARVTLGSWLAIGYLAIFGSVVAYSAYVWLVRVTTPARVSTYAYVNPVVALGVGAVLGGEAITPRVALAAAVLLGAVILINAGGRLGQAALRVGRQAVRAVRLPFSRFTTPSAASDRRRAA